MTIVRMTVLASALFAATALAPADAHQIYQLQANQWAIVCDDGIGYSFSGSQNGAVEVSALLCGPGATAGTGPVDSAALVDAGDYLSRDKAGKLVRVAPITVNEEGVRAAPIIVQEEGVRAAPITVNEEGVRAAPITVQDEGVRAKPINEKDEGLPAQRAVPSTVEEPGLPAKRKGP